MLFGLVFFAAGATAQVTPPDANTDAECGPDCWAFFNFSAVDDGTGTNIPNFGQGVASDNNCNTTIDATIEYTGADSNGPDVIGTSFGANNQGASTDQWAVGFGAPLTDPVVAVGALSNTSSVLITDCDGNEITANCFVSCSTNLVYNAGTGWTGDGAYTLQLSGTYDCINIAVNVLSSDSYTLSVGTCLGADPLPPCVDCGPGNDFEFINLVNSQGTGAGATADIELNNVLVGSAEVLFSDLDISEDLSGTQFGGFDNDGGTYLLALSFCEPITFNQFEIKNLEVESEVSIGTSLSGTGAAATLSGVTLNQCGGSNRMNPNDGAPNLIITDGPGCSANPNAEYTLGDITTDILYLKYTNPVGGCSFDYVGFKLGSCVADGADAVPVCPLTYVTYTTDIVDYVTNGADFVGNDANAFQLMRDANGNLFDQDCSQIQNEVENGIAIPTVAASACAEVEEETECTFCDPAPPCGACPVGTESSYISLSQTGTTGTGLDMGEVFIDGTLYGTYEFLFSDLDVNTDGNGTVFGGFDNDGGTMLLQIDFCAPVDINQLDVRNLEVESMVSVGTTISGTGAAAVLGGQTLTFCQGSDRMDADNITDGNVITTAGPGCGANPNASYTFGTNPVSTLYFKYTNPVGGCSYDYVGFSISTCVTDASADAVPTCPLSVISVTSDIDGYIADINGGGTGDAFVTTLIQDVNGNYFDRTCDNIENAVNNATPIATTQLGPCVEVVSEAECTFCAPTPPCNDCPAGSSYEYISLNPTGTNADGLDQGSIEVDGVCIGQYEFEFSNLGVSEDGQGTLFGGFDNDGGTMLLRIDFCDPTVINQLDIRNLEVESMVSVGTTVVGSGAAAVLSGQTLTFCEGSSRMDADDITNGNTVTTAGPGCGANPNASYTLGSDAISTMYFKYQNPVGGCRGDYIGFRLGLCVEPAPMAIPVCPFETVRVTCDMDAVIANGGVATNANTDTYVVDGAGNYFDFTNCNNAALTNAFENGTMLQTVNIGCAELVETVEECLPQSCVVTPTCAATDCPADSEFDYINLSQNGTNGAGLPMGDIRMDGVVIGDYDFIVSDLDISNDGNGTTFGGFDNDGGTMLLQLNFCEPLLIQELDVRNLEVGSQVSVGTSTSAMDASAVLSGLNMTFCGGSDRMTLNDGAPNLVITDGPGCGANPNATYTVSPQAVSTLYFKYFNPPSDGTFPSICRGDYVGFKIGACRPELGEVLPECDLTLVDEVVTLADGSTETNRLLLDANGRYFDVNSCPNAVPEMPVQEYRLSPCAVVNEVEVCPVCVRPGLAKTIEAVNSPAASGVPSNIDVTFKFTLANYIGEMENLIINDDLTAIPGFVQAFPAQTTVMVSSNTSGNAVAPGANVSYNGTGNILNGTSGFLMEGDAIMVTITAEFDASLVPANLVNVAQGGGSRGGNPPVLDDSVAGTNPDPDGDNEPDNNGDGNPNNTDNGSTLYFPALNVVKKLVETFPVGPCHAAGNVNARFEVTLENTGNVDLMNIQLTDDLIAQLGSAFQDISFIQYAEITASTATTNPNLNNGFNDFVFDSEIFDGTSGLLEPGQYVTVQFIAEINPNAPGRPAVLENQANASATAINPVTGDVLMIPNTNTPFTVTDLSDDGMNPDSTNDDFAGTGQDDPTPLDGRLPAIALTKTTTNVVAAPTAGNQLVTYVLTLANLGDTPATDIQIRDNAASQLGAAFIEYVSGVSVSGNAAQTPTVDEDFDAAGNRDIFVGNDGLLNPGQSISVTFTIEVNSSNVDNPMSLSNQALAIVAVPNADGNLIELNDLSDSGSNPESNNIGAMGDTGCSNDPTPVFGNFPLINQAPMDMTVETYGVGSTPLTDWIANNGGLDIVTPEGCEPAVITNDYAPENFVSNCSSYSGSVDVNFYYSDACGNNYEFSATFELTDTTPPSCVKPADLTIDCNDEDYDEVLASYTAYWGPVTDLSHPITIASSYDADNFDENGQQTIVWTFTDACGNSREWDAVLTVTGDCDEPATELTVTPPANLNLECTDDVPAAELEASTTCASGVVNVSTEEETTAGDCEGSYTLVRTYTATDECGNSETVTQTITVSDNTAPVFTFVPAGADVDCTAYPDGFGTAEATDACSDVTITFEDELEDYICDADFNITRTWTATDACGNVATASQTLIVWPDISAPVFTFVPGDQTIVCPAEPEFGEPVIEDACLGFTVTEEVTSTGSCPGAYTTTKTWTATDGCGNTSVESQTITVLEEASPAILAFSYVPADMTAECGEFYEFGTPVCESNCDAGFTVESEDIVETGVCANHQILTRRWTATDACGNAAICEQVITITDTTAPEFTSVPADKLIGCGEQMVFSAPVTLDVCGGDVTLSFEDETVYNNCQGVSYSTTRTWYATDACGNTAAFENTISVEEDTEAPVVSVLTDKYGTCGSALEFDTPEVSDNCADYTLTYTDDVINTECEIITVRQWTATDGCGNATVTEQSIVLTDEVSPTFNITNHQLVMTPWEYANWTAPAVTAFDDCASAELTGPNVFEYEDGTISYAWVAKDACGNRSSVSIMVSVESPELPNGPVSTTLMLYPNPTTKRLTVGFASDNSGEAEVMVTDLTGRTVMTTETAIYKGDNTVRLEVGDLPAGTYMLSILNGENLMTSRFVKL